VTYPCPYCRATAEIATGCPGCGRGPDPDAAEVARIDAEIAGLHTRLAEAQRAMATTDAALREAWQRRNAAAARVRAAVAASASRTAAPVHPSASAPGSLPGTGARSPEASTRLVQNALFLLGGLLLGIAAIVFTAVAWSQFGVGGRAVLLAGFTAAALVVPPLALRRGLRATAETFAAVGLLLVLLDGYAAWHVNLFGVASYSAYGYAGAVCAVTAAVAAGYEHLTGLTGPRYAALLVAQPVLPLVVAPLEPDATGRAFTLAAVAVLNLAVIHLRRGTSTGIGITAYLLGLLSVVGSAVSALAGLRLAGSAVPAAAAGTALITSALVVLAGALRTRIRTVQAVAGGLLVVAVGVAAFRFVAVTGPGYAPVLAAGVAAVSALAVALLPARIRGGPRVGALLVIAVPALVTLGDVGSAAFRTIEAAHQAGPWIALGQPPDWQMPASVVLLSAGLAMLVPASLRRDVLLGGAALVALAGPAGFGLPWWSGPALNLLVAGAALAVATRLPDVTRAATRPRPAGADAGGGAGTGAAGARSGVGRPGFGFGAADWSLLWTCAVAAALVAHAVVVGYGQAAVAAAVLAGVTALGLGTAAASWPTPRRSDVGGASLTVGLLVVPAMATQVVSALPASTLFWVWPPRAALAGAALVTLAAHLVARRWSPYRGFARAAALLALVTAPLWPLGSTDSPACYAAAALLLVVTTLVIGRRATPAAVIPLVAGVALAVAGTLLSLLAGPYYWLRHVWAGRPAGVGIDPAGLGTVQTGDVAALVLVAAAAGLAAFLGRGISSAGLVGRLRHAVRRGASAEPGSAGGVDGLRAAGWAAAPALALAVPSGLAAAGVPWPGVPAAALLAGSAGLLAVALRPPRTSGTGRLGAAGAGTAVAVVSAALAGAGLAGALPTHGATLAALGTVVIAGAVAGTAARHLPARLAGWLIAVAAALGFAFAAGRTFGLSLPVTAFPVLAAAALTLALGATLSARARARQPQGEPAAARPTARSGVEGRAVQAAAHAGAVVALLLTLGSARHAAAVCTLWGIVLGVRALWPAEPRTARHALVVAAAAAELGGWWLLMSAERVSTLEAYTLPAAAVALLAGRLALRRTPGLTSWLGYGPALAAALLPSLAGVLVGDGQPVRRLVLGLGALAVVIAGSHARLQAPVVIGGGVLTVVALHELVLVWDLLPRWIPLAAAGLLLVGLAMTLERRRRDLARVRSAITRMS
jgi:hypothetical protein